ncbi:MAG: hypothetical protein ACRD9W_00085 [Terriglobia bacterium]
MPDAYPIQKLIRACRIAFAGADPLHVLAGEEAMAESQWTPPGTHAPFRRYRFCKACGFCIHAPGEAEFMGGKFYALAVSTLDDVDPDELAAAPMKFIDNRHDRFDRAPADRRLL